MRSSNEPWEALDAFLEERELTGQENRVFKRVRLAGVCRVPAPLSDHFGKRLEDPEAVDHRLILEEERDRAREEGAKEGFEAGYREGWEAAWREAEDHIRIAMALREEMERARKEALSRLEREVAEMAMEVGEKLALQRLESNPEALQEMVRAIILRATDRRVLKIRMHPKDLRLLSDRSNRLTELITDVERLELVEDRGLLPGGCVLETASGTIDARLECRLERVRGALIPEEGEDRYSERLATSDGEGGWS